MSKIATVTANLRSMVTSGKKSPVKEKVISFRGNKYRVSLDRRTKDWSIFKNTETEPYAVGMTDGYGSLDGDDIMIAKIPEALQQKLETVMLFLTGDPNTQYTDEDDEDEDEDD